MEPITHFLTGAVLGRAGFNRKTALATATMTLAAEAPDLDVFSGFKGPVYGFAHHRGFTHSFLGLLLTSALVTAFMYLVWRLRGRKTNIPALPARWGMLFVFAYIAGLTHILLDFTNNYGVRPFWPFWEKWYSWDVAFILEPPILAFLLAGLIVPALFPRAKRGQYSRAIATMALLCVVILWASRYYRATKIDRVLQTQTFHSEPPINVSSYPYWTRVSRYRIGLRWSAVVETRSLLVTSEVAPSTGQLASQDLEIIPKPPDTPAILAAKRSYVGRVYLDWARYPLVTEADEGDDTVVNFRDLRFGYPQLRRNTILTASVRLDHRLRVIGEAMGPRSQNPPID
ncbi:MAG TPA: metal-dependent hydrolase [Terriglobales bacterium]|nr:metal-dependent hydrolase [Terriglobales bacterium]